MTNDNTNISMPVPAICTQCGGQVYVDSSQEQATCEYCGTTFIVEKAIHNFNTQNIRIDRVESVNINKRGAVESVLNFVEKQQEKKQQKLEEEKRQLEEERKRQEKEKKKEETKAWIIYAVILIPILVFSLIMAAKEKKDNIGKINMPASANDFVGENYEDVVDDLEKAGFTNIETDIIDDLVFGWFTKDGEVEEVEVDGDSSFSSSDYFEEDVEIIVTYHTFPESDSDEESAEEETEAVAVEEEPTEVGEEEPEPTDEVEPNEETEPTEEAQVEATATQKPVLTVDNSEDLVTLLSLRDPNDPFVKEFAKKYKGRIIEFDANIAHMMNHGAYTTRYDFLIYVGDYSETSVIGPSFKFEDCNVSDLNLIGEDIPETIGQGDNIHITAEVLEYNDLSGLFFLKPVTTKFR